jgi:hypothetical protein
MQVHEASNLQRHLASLQLLSRWLKPCRQEAEQAAREGRGLLS